VAVAPSTIAAEQASPALPELTPGRAFTAWQADPYALALVLLLGGLYAWGVLRLVRRGERWSAVRTAAFAVVGLGTIVVGTMSFLVVYGKVLFWPVGVQNLLLDLIAPLGLALGDPLSLAYRVLPARAGDRLHRVMRGPLVRLLTFPAVSTALVLASELCIYFTPYLPAALRNDHVHQLMYLQLLVVGSLFVLPMLTREELLPGWCGPPLRALFVFLDGLVDAVPGVVILTSGTLIAGGWYGQQHRGWGPSAQRDQQIGGGLMLTIAELIGVPFLIAVFVDWVRSERARTAELDRALDRALIAVPVPAQKQAKGQAGGQHGQTQGAAPRPAAAPELTRPWWETDQGEVGERFRQGRGAR
jgi:cytochrome c oxidase assembly factor CtaG